MTSSLFPGIFQGIRFAEPGQQYSFSLIVNQILPMTCIEKVTLSLGQHKWYWDTCSSVPCRLDGKIRIPSVSRSHTWHPEFIIEGCTLAGINSATCLRVPLTLTATSIKPIFNASLACSNWAIDQWKIDPIRDYLSNWGFGYTTLGREKMSSSPAGGGLIESENEWAKNGDCFISVLTSRDNLSNNISVPSAWPHAESGFAYDKNKPYLVFVEDKVRVDAVYRNLNEDQIIRFNPTDIISSLRYSSNKLSRFRRECNKYRSIKMIDKAVDVAKTTCTVVLGIVILDQLISK